MRLVTAIAFSSVSIISLLVPSIDARFEYVTMGKKAMFSSAPTGFGTPDPEFDHIQTEHRDALNMLWKFFSNKRPAPLPPANDEKLVKAMYTSLHALREQAGWEKEQVYSGFLERELGLYIPVRSFIRCKERVMSSTECNYDVFKIRIDLTGEITFTLVRNWMSAMDGVDTVPGGARGPSPPPALPTGRRPSRDADKLGNILGKFNNGRNMQEFGAGYGENERSEEQVLYSSHGFVYMNFKEHGLTSTPISQSDLKKYHDVLEAFAAQRFDYEYTEAEQKKVAKVIRAKQTEIYNKIQYHDPLTEVMGFMNAEKGIFIEESKMRSRFSMRCAYEAPPMDLNCRIGGLVINRDANGNLETGHMDFFERGTVQDFQSTTRRGLPDNLRRVQSDISMTKRRTPPPPPRYAEV